MVSMAAAQNLRSTSRVKTHRTIHTPDPYYAGDPDHRYGSPTSHREPSPCPWANPGESAEAEAATSVPGRSITPHKLGYGAPKTLWWKIRTDLHLPVELTPPVGQDRESPHISPSLDHFERVHLAFWWLNSAWCSPQRYLKGGDFLPWSLEQKTALEGDPHPSIESHTPYIISNTSL